MIASGLRNSIVFLHDTRSGGSAARLQHQFPVSNIRRIDDHRIVVTGHTSVSRSIQICIFVCLVGILRYFLQMQMYDIRYAPNGIQRKPRPLSSSHTSTKPYLTFPGYVPNVDSNFDVSTELGLLASGKFLSLYYP